VFRKAHSGALAFAQNGGKKVNKGFLTNQ